MSDAAFNKLGEHLNELYRERNRVVAALAWLAWDYGYRVGTARTDIPGWDAEWHGCVYIDLPTGQISWHYHDSEALLFEGLPEYDRPSDGHDTPEKYRRVDAFVYRMQGDPSVGGPDRSSDVDAAV